ncbi:amidohydrolase family protein, partial [bacterium]|nr:amidohydrolase family protein [bacterium]
VRGGYPKGKITPGGAVDRLLQNYPNIYGELSAGSGHNALTRDPDFTPGFFERNWNKLLFGTDYLGPGQNLPIVQFLKDYPLDKEKKDAIAYKNIEEILGLHTYKPSFCEKLGL